MSKNKQMQNDDKANRGFVAIVRKLKEDKGIIIKKSDFDNDIREVKKAQAKLDALRKQDDNAATSKYIDDAHDKLQNILSDINNYMGTLYPEGLIEIDGSPEGQGQKIMVSG